MYIVTVIKVIVNNILCILNIIEVWIMEINSLLLIKDYGKITIKLKELMDEHNITRNQLANMINSRFEVINKWYNNDVEKLDLDVLARICYVLNCKVEDIIKYE